MISQQTQQSPTYFTFVLKVEAVCLLEAVIQLTYNESNSAHCRRVVTEVKALKLLRTIFQDHDEHNSSEVYLPKLVLVLDMEDDLEFNTNQIPGLTDKMDMALPGIFPDDCSPLAHNCGGKESGIPIHSFREEIEHGTDIPHLLEHIILFLFSKRTAQCSGYCGQRSIDIEQGILTHYYIVVDYPSKIEAVIGVDLAMQLVRSWMQGKTVVIERDVLLAGVQDRLDPMLSTPITTEEPELLVS